MEREITPILKSLMKLISKMGRDPSIKMTEQNQVLTAMMLDTDEKIRVFFQWVRSKLNENQELTVNETQIMNAVARIERGEKTE